LQATAEDAGQQSVNKVTNRLEVLNAHGFVAPDGDHIDQLNLTVRLAAGSGSVDMDNATIKYMSDSEAATLTNGTSVSSSEFITTEVKDDDDSLGVLNSPDDRFEVGINSSLVEGGSTTGLSTGETVKLEITTRTGGTTTVILTMPQELAGKSPSDPVAL
jgi:flagellin FlaB